MTTQENPVDDALARFWTQGIFRGEADSLAALAEANANSPKSVELKAVARLAALINGNVVEGDQAAADDLSPVVNVLILSAQAWTAATAGRYQEVNGRLAELSKAVTSMKTSSESSQRKISAEAWSLYVSAECAYLAGTSYICRSTLNKLLQTSKCPIGLTLAARIRMGFVEGLDRPIEAVRQLDSAVSLAVTAGSLIDHIHALTYAALYMMLGGNLDGARTRFERAVEETNEQVPRSYTTISRLFLACMTASIDSIAAHQQIAGGIQSAAEDGDYLCYVSLITMGARLYMSDGLVTDAVATLSNGIAHLTLAGGPIAAAPLTAERQMLQDHIGEDAYNSAIREILEEME